MGDYTIGIKSGVAKRASFLKYDGSCYYRLGTISYENNIRTNSIERYYLPLCPLYTQTLTSLALCAHGCAQGEQKLNRNVVLNVPPDNNWFQFKFTGNIGDVAVIKYTRHDGTYFTKNLKYKSVTKLIFDEYGPDQHEFDPRRYPETVSFVDDDVNYCMTYASPGSFVFVMAVSANPAIHNPEPPVTPTPTPTPEPTEPGAPPPDFPPVLCDGENYCTLMGWSASGDDSIAFWFDAGDESTIRTNGSNPIASDGDPVVMWRDKSRHNRHAEQIDSMDYAPVYVSSGKVGGGPGIKFTQDFTNGSDYLSWDPGNLRLDYRAVFIVATTDKLRGNGEQGLLTANSPYGGATTAYGNMFTLEGMRSFWSGVKIGTTVRQSIFSETYTGGDGGQYYYNGSAVPDNHPVVGYGTSMFVDAAIIGGVRHPAAPNLPMDGLCIGARHKLQAGFGPGWDGEINEIIILDKTPTDRMRQEIEGYLAWKWGLADYLPIDHPCRHGICQFPTPTPTPPPTPPAPTPEATPIFPDPEPDVPDEPVEGVNLVTSTQLFDVLTQRDHTSTLWCGALYENEYNIMSNRLASITSEQVLLDYLDNAAKYIGDIFTTTVALDDDESWRAKYHSHNLPSLTCPGEGKSTIRAPWNPNFPDNLDNELVYCVGNIFVGSKLLSEILTEDHMNTLISTLASTNTDVPDMYNISYFENLLSTPLAIDSPGFRPGAMDIYLPLTTIYRLPADLSNPSPLSWRRPKPLHVGESATRVDVAAHLMYHHDGLAFWQVPVVFDNRYYVEITVKLPGASDNSQSYIDLMGSMPWNIQMEVHDMDTGIGLNDSVSVNLPESPGAYIPSTIDSITTTRFTGYRFKITPYGGKWNANSSSELIANAAAGILPVLFLRIDREFI